MTAIPNIDARNRIPIITSLPGARHADVCPHNPPNSLPRAALTARNAPAQITPARKPVRASALCRIRR